MSKPINLDYSDANNWGLPKINSYLYVQTDLIPEKVAEYVRLIEMENTNRICKCEWIAHPADEGKEEGQRRVRRGEPAIDCPVHTKEGFLIGFFRWLIAGPESKNLMEILVGQYETLPQKEQILIDVPEGSYVQCDYQTCTREMDHHDDHWLTSVPKPITDIDKWRNDIRSDRLTKAEYELPDDQ